MALAWVVLFFGTKGCIDEHYCHDGDADAGNNQAADTAAPPAAPDVAPDRYALETRTGLAGILTGSLTPGLIASLTDSLEKYPGYDIKVIGRYYESEQVPAGSEFGNMGLLRASDIADVLVDKGFPRENIIESAYPIQEEAKPDGEIWQAGVINFAPPVNTAAPETSRVEKVTETFVKIYFPYNKGTKKLEASTETYLEKLAKEMVDAGTTVAIVGHTDERGRDEYNMSLGQTRADFVKQRLVSYGAPAGAITTSSRGETAPELDRQTEKAYRLNRRAELTLTRK